MYDIFPEAFNDIQSKINNNTINIISMKLKKINNPMIFFIICCVLNISINKQKQLINLLNIEWDNNKLVYSS